MVPRPGIATRGAAAGARQRVPVFLNRRNQKSPRISARASIMVPRPGIATRGAAAGARLHVPGFSTARIKKAPHFHAGLSE